MRPRQSTEPWRAVPRRILSRYTTWANVEHGDAARIAVMVPLGPIFLGLLPFVVARVGPRLDRRLGLPHGTAPANRIAGGLLMGGGYLLGMWAVASQLSRGRGTPLPVMPTRELLTDGPFRYCRNPMTLGAILAYLGMAVAAGTRAGAALVLTFAASLLAYLKGIEEAELAERFGEPYLAYRQRTPFIIPRPPRRD